jgi:hypothetical protein
LIAEAKSPAFFRHQIDREAKCHWFEVEVYRTTGDCIIAHIGYRWAGSLFREVSQDHVFHGSQSDVTAWIRGFDHAGCIGGFPEGKEFLKKQHKLIASVTEDYGLLVDVIEQKLLDLAEPEVLT